MPDMNENAETQQEYFGKVHTDNKETLQNALKRIEELEKENAELKEINEGYNRNRDKLIAMGFPTFKSCKEYSGKLTNLQKENATLKKQLEEDNYNLTCNLNVTLDRLNEATELLKATLLMAQVEGLKVRYETVDDIEQFLKE